MKKETYVNKLKKLMREKDLDMIDNKTKPIFECPRYNKVDKFENEYKKAYTKYEKEVNKFNNALLKVKNNQKLEDNYVKAVKLYDENFYDDCLCIFENMIEYKDSYIYISRCKEKIKEIREQKKREENLRKVEKARIEKERAEKEAARLAEENRLRREKAEKEAARKAEEARLAREKAEKERQRIAAEEHRRKTRKVIIVATVVIVVVSFFAFKKIKYSPLGVDVKITDKNSYVTNQCEVYIAAQNCYDINLSANIKSSFADIDSMNFYVEIYTKDNRKIGTINSTLNNMALRSGESRTYSVIAEVNDNGWQNENSFQEIFNMDYKDLEFKIKINKINFSNGNSY